MRKDPDPNCPWCLGEGVVDSGGFTPWDTGIDVACSCTYACPADATGKAVDCGCGGIHGTPS